MVIYYFDLYHQFFCTYSYLCTYDASYAIFLYDDAWRYDVSFYKKYFSMNNIKKMRHTTLVTKKQMQDTCKKE